MAGISRGLVDVSPLTKLATDEIGLLPQPENPKYRCALVQVYVRSHEHGGYDKSGNGHRYDSITFANGIISAGISCQLMHYVHEEHENFFNVCRDFDAILLRCNPGMIKQDGGDQARFNDGMRELRHLGIHVWPSPEVMERMGAKNALSRISSLSISLEDTEAYNTPEEFAAGFKKSVAFRPRVIKQDRGSSGEGIWIVKLKSGNYCSSYGERCVSDDEDLTLLEACDDHIEEKTVGEFIEFCTKGKTEKAGTWETKSPGGYLTGGVVPGGQIVDQRFCPRIVEGEVRYSMVGDSLVDIIHMKPGEGHISTNFGTGCVFTHYSPDEPRFAELTSRFLQKDLPQLMRALGLEDHPIPLWWTADFILASEVGTPVEEEKWIVGEFNCSCVGMLQCSRASWTWENNPKAGHLDIPQEDIAVAASFAELLGQKALAILDGGRRTFVVKEPEQSLPQRRTSKARSQKSCDARNPLERVISEIKCMSKDLDRVTQAAILMAPLAGYLLAWALSSAAKPRQR